jgi:hypothetical protein
VQFAESKVTKRKNETSINDISTLMVWLQCDPNWAPLCFLTFFSFFLVVWLAVIN